MVLGAVAKGAWFSHRVWAGTCHLKLGGYVVRGQRGNGSEGVFQAKAAAARTSMGLWTAPHWTLSPPGSQDLPSHWKGRVLDLGETRNQGLRLEAV